MWVFADRGAARVLRVFVLCQFDRKPPRCGGRSVYGGRRAALDVADDVGVRVRVDAVMDVSGR
jgi:hypothetical protein